MGNLEKQEPRTSLKFMLACHGTAMMDLPVINVPSASMRLELQLICGFDIALPDDSTGRLIVRQVASAADQYIAGLPTDHERSVEFYQNRLTGILADAQVYSTSHRGIYVARRTFLEMETRDGGMQVSFNSRQDFGVGRQTDEIDQFMNWDISQMRITRELSGPERDYTEPSKLRMIWTALTA